MSTLQPCRENHCEPKNNESLGFSTCKSIAKSYTIATTCAWHEGREHWPATASQSVCQRIDPIQILSLDAIHLVLDKVVYRRIDFSITLKEINPPCGIIPFQ